MKKLLITAAAAAMMISATTASAGVGGDFFNYLAPGAGTFLDEIHRGIKHANPSYGQWEEGVTNQFREDIGLQPHCEPFFNKWGEEVGCF